MQEIMISFIIPAHNAERTLETTVNSIVSRNMSSIEIIIVENGSIDQTKHIGMELSERHSNVKLITSEKGVSNARNCGLEQANGEWIIFIDADDLWLENIENELRKSTEEIVAFGYQKQKHNSVIFSEKYPQCAPLVEAKECIRLAAYPETGLGVIWAKAFRRSLLMHEKLKFHPQLRYAEDIEFILRCYACVNQIKVISKIVYGYVLNEDSVTQSYNSKLPEEYKKTMRHIVDNANIDIDVKNHVIFEHFVFTVFKETFHPVKKSYKKMVGDYIALKKDPVYAIALKEIGYVGLSLKKKIILWSIKYNFTLILFGLTWLNYKRKQQMR